MTSASNPPAFRLETSDGDEEGSAEVNKGKNEPPPMESPFQGEDRNFSPQIKVNLNYRKGLGPSQQDPNRFDRDRLFSVVSRGVPEELTGLLEYLRRTSKYLTDSAYTEGSTGKTCLLQMGARLCPTVQLEDICNHQGLTPLKLAAKEGKIEIFRHILQREFSGLYQPLSRKFTEWCYGPVRVSLYDLSSVDSWEKNSVLEIIAFHCKSPHRHRMVVLEPLNKLLQEKWDRLIPRFFFNFACYLVYMIIFTIVAYHQPSLEQPAIPSSKATFGDSMLLLGHILILLGGIYLLLGQLWYFWRRRLFIWISFMDSYFEILFLVQALLTVLSQVLRFVETEWYLPLLVNVQPLQTPLWATADQGRRWGLYSGQAVIKEPRT